jgi:hypothetical protein
MRGLPECLELLQADSRVDPCAQKNRAYFECRNEENIKEFGGDGLGHSKCEALLLENPRSWIPELLRVQHFLKHRKIEQWN